MPAKREPPKSKSDLPRPSEHDDSEAVSAYLASLQHPLRPVVEAVRRSILKADPRITEGIKWSSPSFWCNGWFATADVRGKQGVLVVLHHGAKVKSESRLQEQLDDPRGLVKWLARDRAVVRFSSEEEFAQARRPFQSIIRQWAAYQAKSTRAS